MLLRNESQDCRPRWKGPLIALVRIAAPAGWPKIGEYVRAASCQRLDMVDGGRRTAANPAAVIPVHALSSQLLRGERNLGNAARATHRLSETYFVRICAMPRLYCLTDTSFVASAIRRIIFSSLVSISLIVITGPFPKSVSIADVILSMPSTQPFLVRVAVGGITFALAFGIACIVVRSAGLQSLAVDPVVLGVVLALFFATFWDRPVGSIMGKFVRAVSCAPIGRSGKLPVSILGVVGGFIVMATRLADVQAAVLKSLVPMEISQRLVDTTSIAALTHCGIVPVLKRSRSR
jgi:hypothetical protein